MSEKPNTNTQKVSFLILAWIVLGWEVAWLVGGKFGGLYDLHWRFDFPFHLRYSAGWAISGLIGGLFTGLAFFYKGLFKNWMYIFWITLGWASAGMTHGWLVWVIFRSIAMDDQGRHMWTYHIGPAMSLFGLIGGLITSVVLFDSKILRANSGLFWIPIGWAFGCYLGAEHLICQELNLFCYPQQWIKDDLYYLNAGLHFSIIGGVITWLMIRFGRRSIGEG